VARAVLPWRGFIHSFFETPVSAADSWVAPRMAPLAVGALHDGARPFVEARDASMRSAEVGRGAGWGRASRRPRCRPFRWVAGGRGSDGRVAPVTRDLKLGGAQAHGPGADCVMESILDPVLLVIARTDLRPEVRDAVRRRDVVLGVNTLLD
jgi:hypothetical protein